MAAGVDPKKTILFNQSQVHEHAELAWVFNCVAVMACCGVSQRIVTTRFP
jgi:tryptophanyl-tRNA synthetase